MSEEATEVKPKKRGRPKKSLVEANKRGSRGAVGRPKGDAAIINEYKARMLASPKSQKVLDSIMNAALNDEHKNQAAAWKLLMDRMLPVSYFEKDKLSGGRNSVSITISGINSEAQITTDPAVVEGEYTEYE
ncbi:MAG: hypothetical protein VW715_16450 [Rhodospirillales bacterium]